MKIKIPLSKPFINEEESVAVKKVIDSKLLATGGVVKHFEKALANNFKRTYCVAVNSGTSALYIALTVCNLHKIIMPALTCPAVLYATLSARKKPLFSDVESETHNIDLFSLSEAELKAADGIIVTHTYGHAADLNNIQTIASKYALFLIEDFAQATGGYYKNKILGSFGDIAVTSFYGPKSITTGHGGAIFTDDREIYEKCLFMRGDKTAKFFANITPLNLHMPDINAAIGLAQLNRISDIIDMRRKASESYTTQLKNANIICPVEKKYATHTYYKYAVVLPNTINKIELINKMWSKGIEVGGLYDPPLHKLKISSALDTAQKQLPVTESVAPHTISLPIFREIKMDEIKAVCDALQLAIQNEV